MIDRYEIQGRFGNGNWSPDLGDEYVAYSSIDEAEEMMRQLAAIWGCGEDELRVRRVEE